MAGTTSIKQVHKGKVHAALRELIIAWANDADTHAATYILELGPERSGAKSRSLCPGCGSPLIAVNNAKSQRKVRPHFRHHQGVNSKNCSIVAARLAILRSMHELGWIDLPAREHKASVTGLDGESYEGIASRPPERVYITKVEFSNSTPAVLHCADGRKINVVLHGEAASSYDPTATGATIVIEVDDPDIALMDPQELRRLITVNPAACWRQHWNDAQIEEEANGQARETAIEHLALAPDDLELPSDMPAELKTETVLHYAVKHILKEAGELYTPEDVVYAEAFSEIRRHHQTWRLPEQRLALSNVELEKRLGLTRPDLVCQAVDTSTGPSYPALCIEVTVTNGISEERHSRIQKVGLPAIEINLRGLQGRITKDKLKQLVSGIKRHIAVDTQGLPHAVAITTAEVTDRKGALAAFQRCKQSLGRVQSVLTDSGYTGAPFAQGVKDILGEHVTVQIAKRSELHGFKVMPKRWVVERSFAWLEKNRRLWKNCERWLNTSLQFVHLAFLALLLRRS